MKQESINIKENGGRKIHFRRTHKKSHLGCQNCKTRRIKCNEQLPVCAQCVRARAHCSYLDLSESELAERQRKKAEDLAQVQQLQKHSALPFPSTKLSPKILPSASSLPSSNSVSPSHGLNGMAYGAQIPSMNLPPISGLTPCNYNSPQSLPPVSSLDVSAINPLGPLQIFPAGPKSQLLRQGFETDMMRSVYQQWMSGVLSMAACDINLFHALMSFSYGFLAIKTGRLGYRVDADKHRFIAVRQLQKELGKEKISNTDALLATALILSWDVFFQDGDMQSYVTLSKGLAAVLEKIQITLSATPTALCTSDALFQGIKSIQVPPYNSKFVDELLVKIKSIEHYITSSRDEILIIEHNNLYRFMADVSLFLRTNQRSKSFSHNMYYSPEYLFNLLREWLKSFPLNAQSLNAINNDYKLVLYVYYHATTRALDALFPEVRYLFQFGFIGPIDSVGIENLIGSYAENYLLRYPLKILTFFKERLFLINRLLASKPPLESSPIDDITEIQIQSFETTIIQPENYPTSASELISGHSQSMPDSFTCRSNYSSSGESVKSVNNDSSSTSNTSVSSMGSPKLDPAKSMSIFKAYFVDRMDILQSLKG